MVKNVGVVLVVAVAAAVAVAVGAELGANAATVEVVALADFAAAGPAVVVVTTVVVAVLDVAVVAEYNKHPLGIEDNGDTSAMSRRQFPHVICDSYSSMGGYYCLHQFHSLLGAAVALEESAVSVAPEGPVSLPVVFAVDNTAVESIVQDTDMDKNMGSQNSLV